ncbi:MAG TPA: trehalose-6-phosphate synthase [Peptococcaceae bacterium]|nr:trehalose-6-phosphate synthase [Peptococcaceae bacterium]
MERWTRGFEKGKNRRMILVSNRASYVLKETFQGLKGERTVGGLVSALEPLMAECGGVWVAWGGRSGEKTKGVRIGVPIGKPRYTLREVVLSPEEIEGYYHAFANRVLWPLCHYFLERCTFRQEDWEIYKAVNEKFATFVLEEALPGDLIWVHDYHLSLVPQLIRHQLPGAQIGFFWHIPFPDVEVFRVLPQARQVLEGLLGSNFIGFHVPSYCLNFLDAVESILGASVDREKGVVDWKGRRVFIKDLPVGVDYQAFSEIARRPDVQKSAQKLRALLGTEFVLLGVDRLDYTKGIKERLQGFELFLESNPQYQGRLTYVQIAVPTRSGIPEYQDLRHQVEEMVGRINGRFGKPGWTPVVYCYRALERSELVAYYLAADLLLVTPLRDGLNLVAKEYVASRLEDDGVLVLSAFAGVAEELTEALIVNPFDLQEVSNCIKTGLEMPRDEKARRMASLRSAVTSRDITWWLDTFIATWISLASEKGLRVLSPGRREAGRPVTGDAFWGFIEEKVKRKGELP